MIRKPIFIVAVLGMILVLTTCGGNDSDSSRRNVTAGSDLETYRQALLQVESVPIRNPQTDPLQAALGLIGLNTARLELPLYLEENYRLLARNPLIDRLARNPLALPGWAEETSNGLQGTRAADLFQIVDRMTMSLNGGVSYAGRLRPQADAAGGLSTAYEYLCRQNGRPVLAEELARIHKAGFTPAFDHLLGTLVYALADASQLSRKAVAGLSAQEIEFLATRPERYFFTADGTFRFLSAPTYTQARLLRLARKIDFPSLFAAGLILARAVDRVTAAVQAAGVLPYRLPFFQEGHNRTGVILDLEAPIGPIIVLGPGDDTLDRACALVVDLGGNDRYAAPTAVGHLVPGRSALHIDLGGDDYYGKKTLSFAQGVGCLSVGLLADFDGRDQYRSAHMAQGCGFYGLGLMVDFSGDDIYSMGLMGQGFGVFGIGLLLDRSGNDRYLAAGMGQGAGSTMGYGVLCDMQGNDKYLADRQRPSPGLEPDAWCHAQGAGLSIRSPDWERQPSFYGGIGLLSDGGGDDFYHATGGNCMGSSYFMSVGALVDHGGDDTYIPEKGYGIGFAVHLSNAVLMDRGGNDQYFAASHTGGVASDRSIALLVDCDGDDLYGPTEQYVREANAARAKEEADSPGEARTQATRSMAALSYGSAQKRKALGFLIDMHGNDRYFAQVQGQGESLGGVMPPQFPQYWSHAVLLDLDGQDQYTLPGRRDNTYFRYQGHGICYDTERAGWRLPQTVTGSASRQAPPSSVRVAKESGRVYSPTLEKLGEPDLFVRFQALGALLQHGPATLDVVLSSLAVSDDTEMNRDLLEVLNYFYFSHELQAGDGERLGRLLYAPDPHVRQYGARLIGALALPGAYALLAKALTTAAADTQPHIIWAMGHSGTGEAARTLLAVVQKTLEPESRQAAAEALKNTALQKSAFSAMDEEALRSGLRALLDDEDEIIRFQAAIALQRYSDNPEVLTHLRTKFKDPSIYVRRAAAQTVIQGGDKQGIAVLIDTLRFPSIDTFAFYDEDLPKDLAYYCGVDFADERRYAFDTWNGWWRQHGPNVDLDHNLSVKKEIEGAFATYPEQSGIAVFDQLMQREAGNAMVKRRYERFCRDRIRYLLGHRTITRAIIARCIVLQRKLVTLEPEDLKLQVQLQVFEKRLSQL